MIHEPTPEELARIPKLGATGHLPRSEKAIAMNLTFLSSQWHLIEYSHVDGTAFGFYMPEYAVDKIKWGYIDYGALRDLHIDGYEVERNVNWDARNTLSDISAMINSVDRLLIGSSLRCTYVRNMMRSSVN